MYGNNQQMDVEIRILLFFAENHARRCQCVNNEKKLPETSKLFFPNLQPLAAVGADINIFPAGHQFFAKLFVVIVIPNLFKGLGF